MKRDPSAITRVHPYAWLWEPLEDEPTFVLRAMFGAKAAYVGGKLMLCFIARAEPWRGLLVCTEREHHEALRQEFPALTPHAILPKWLYLADDSDGFESTAARLVQLVRRRDPRIGVEPGTRQRAKAKRSAKTRRQRSDGRRRKPEA
ncbi:hypothetical protein [Opitutus sp. ER46]|uniref:hypothetical protein n=1 Tax=Opitutus sp. ER46 TaxID=2161864 RepID=UPI000D2F7946|nr:hypothetical protein [Opitutus sp. ER46]PTX98508.1 hypothetical protein DB354_04390 [Opitutus sp. ER46]